MRGQQWPLFFLMLPTFDFANLIKKVCSLALAVIHSPVAIFTAFAGSFAVAVSIYINVFIDIQSTFPSLYNDLESLFQYFDSDLSRFIAYCLDYSDFLLLWHFVETLFYTLAVALTSFLGSLFALLWVYKVSIVLRAAIKDKGL